MNMTLEGVKISGKQLKVNNWAGFLLSRLQLLYAKGDCCDLTLKFTTGEELKVHKLILNTCTNYFTQNMEMSDVITVPDSLPFPPVHTIVKFMYSGLLEFKSENYALLLSVAKTLNIPFLVKLLCSQNVEDIGKLQMKTPLIKDVVPPAPTDPNKKPVTMSPASSVLQSSQMQNMLNTKKLPIWRKKTVIRTTTTNIYNDEDPKPARFEWPGEEEESTTILLATPSFNAISYECQPIMKPAMTNNTLSPSPCQLFETPIKKRVMPPINHTPSESSKESDSSLSNTESNKVTEEMSDDDDDGHFETIHNYDYSDDDTTHEPEPRSISPQPPKPILKPSNDALGPTPPKKVRFSFSPEEKKEAEEKMKDLPSPKPSVEISHPTTTPNSTLTPISDPPSSLSGSAPIPKTSPSTPSTLIVPPNNSESPDKGDISSSHAKIIAEVLKKFPDLVKNNKNIKLKISAANSSSPLSVNRNVNNKNKASYVVVKSSPLEKGGSNQVVINSSTTSSLAENLTGPWFCKTCGDASGCELQFTSYYSFRKHLQNVHNEKIDSRMCEYCGHRSTKRNLQLYHLYTKHNVAPPKNIKFPKCNQCNYVALTETLLAKHLNSHQAASIQCGMCQISFQGMESYQAHALTCRPNALTKGFFCKICKKTFTSVSSKTEHAKVCRGGQYEEDEDDPEIQENQGVEMIEVPVLGLDKSGHTLVQFPPGIILAESPNMALIPSSESSSLNSVASGIATSIGLTVQLPDDQAVILLDGNSDFFLQGNENVVVSNSSQMQEFIVPEILDGDMRHLYSASTSVPYTMSNVIPYSSVVQLQTTTPNVNSVTLGEGVETLTTPISHLGPTVEALSQPPTTATVIGSGETSNESTGVPSKRATISESVKPFNSNVSIMVVNAGEPRAQASSKPPVESATSKVNILKSSSLAVLKESPRTNLKKKVENQQQSPSLIMEVEEQKDSDTSEVESSPVKVGAKATNLIQEWEMDDDDDNSVIDDPELKPLRASLDEEV